MGAADVLNSHEGVNAIQEESRMRVSNAFLAAVLAGSTFPVAWAMAMAAGAVERSPAPPASTVTVAAGRPSTRDKKASDGYQLIAGPEFSIQVRLMETLVTGSGDRKSSLYIYDYIVTDNASGGIHGGRGKNRLESSVGDMERPVRWQFRDLNGDGYTDFRYYQGDGKGHDFWWAQVWEPKGRRFLFAKEFAGKS